MRVYCLLLMNHRPFNYKLSSKCGHLWKIRTSGKSYVYPYELEVILLCYIWTDIQNLRHQRKDLTSLCDPHENENYSPFVKWTLMTRYDKKYSLLMYHVELSMITDFVYDSSLMTMHDFVSVYIWHDMCGLVCKTYELSV